MEDEKLKATKKAMGLLQHMDRTEWELRSKLEQAGFSEEVVEAAIQYVPGIIILTIRGMQSGL